MRIEGDTETLESRVRSRARIAVALAAALVLGACGGGGDSGNEVTIGSGQDGDPVTLEFPVFYVKRPVPSAQMAAQFDARRLRRFEVGADLYMRDRASPTAPERNLTAEITQALGDVRDVEVNYEGTKVVFSMRAPFMENADEDEQPTWNIWEYDIATRALRRIIGDDNVAEEGHDVAPYYLPDGRIVFSSTRQRRSRAVLTDEGKTPFSGQTENGQEPAFVLHVMRPDGSDIRQISFNQSHDRDPSVLPSGQIVFSRWDNFGRGAGEFNLYRMNPDGRGLELLYGTHSHATGTIDPADNRPGNIQFLEPRPMPDGRMLTIARPFTGTQEGGDLLLIDTDRFVENNQPTLENASLTGPAQERALPTDVRTIPGPSPGGRYRSAFPLFDGTNRLLVSWSQCRLLEDTRIVPCTAERLSATDPAPVEAPTLFGIYVYDTTRDTQQPVVAPEEGFTFTEVVAAAPRALPPVILDAPVLNDALALEDMGVLHIRSVYDFDGVYGGPAGTNLASIANPSVTPWPNRPYRFMRIEKAVSIPNNDVRQVPNSNFGPGGRARGFSEILGYAPVEPDGSVRVAVPANVALSISFTDANGRRISPRHTNWLQLAPGEVRECNGCHTPNTTPLRAHGRSGLFQRLNTGASMDGAFAGANPLLSARVSETMAQTRNRTVCPGEFCKASVNLIFNDFWTPGTRAAPIEACYRAGATDVIASELGDLHTCSTSVLVPPTTAACGEDFSSLCRITIHYPTHIHPLWNAARMNAAGLDARCTNCHTTVDANNVLQAPQGQLDLTDGMSEDNPEQMRAYRELLFGDVAQAVNGAALEDICLARDPVTNVCVTFQNVPASLSVNAGAVGSTRFFPRFAANSGDAVHAGALSAAELRLISEWVDIGGQYYNDPFKPDPVQ